MFLMRRYRAWLKCPKRCGNPPAGVGLIGEFMITFDCRCQLTVLINPSRMFARYDTLFSLGKLATYRLTT